MFSCPQDPNKVQNQKQRTIMKPQEQKKPQSESQPPPSQQKIKIEIEIEIQYQKTTDEKNAQRQRPEITQPD
jgi:ssDNA-binding replication factor A large subunit